MSYLQRKISIIRIRAAASRIKHEGEQSINAGAGREMITLEEAFIISNTFFLLAVPAIIKHAMRWITEKAIGKEINWTEV